MRFANNRGHSGLYNYALDKKNPKQLDIWYTKPFTHHAISVVIWPDEKDRWRNWKDGSLRNPPRLEIGKCTWSMILPVAPTNCHFAKMYFLQTSSEICVVSKDRNIRKCQDGLCSAWRKNCLTSKFGGKQSDYGYFNQPWVSLLKHGICIAKRKSNLARFRAFE